ALAQELCHRLAPFHYEGQLWEYRGALTSQLQQLPDRIDSFSAALDASSRLLLTATSGRFEQSARHTLTERGITLNETVANNSTELVARLWRGASSDQTPWTASG